MKIDFAIHSVDDNKLYSDFWSPVSKVWKEKMGIEPVLLVLKDKESFNINDFDTRYGTVINIDPVAGVPTYLQCLWVRYWYPTLHPEKVSVISDIDMFPISKRYFVDQLSTIDSEKYVHLNPVTNGSLPSCYHVAKGKSFKKVLELPDQFDSSLKELTSYQDQLLHVDHMGFNLWGIDESYATMKIVNHSDKSDFVFLQRHGHRIDRSNWRYSEDALLNSDVYVDSHSIRPYHEHKQEIDRLVNLILGA